MEGHHLYFRAALYGAVLFAVALGIRGLLSWLWPGYQPFESDLIRYIRPLLKEEVGVKLDEQTRRAEWVVTAVYSLVFGIMSGALLNIFTPRRWALLRSVGAFDALFLRAQADDLPVQLTLSSGKVYIGIVVSTADPTREPVVVSIIPMFSGFRDAEGRMTLTTDYDTVYSNLRMGRATQLGLPAHWLSQSSSVRGTEVVGTASIHDLSSGGTSAKCSTRPLGTRNRRCRQASGSVRWIWVGSTSERPCSDSAVWCEITPWLSVHSQAVTISSCSAVPR